MNDNLFFIGRHGSTLLSSAGDRLEGWGDGPEARLDEQGILDARNLGAFITRLQPQIKYVICSDMGRAIETASIICTIAGIEEFEINNRLRPVNNGEWEGKPKADYDFAPFWKDKSLKFPGGESIDDFEARQIKLARELIKKIQGGEIEPCTLLVIAHSTVISFWHRLQSGDVSDQYMESESDLVKPGGLVLVTDNEVLPVLNRNTDPKMKYSSKDGTALTGFVTDIENRPPRECWNCKHFSRDVAGGQCDHSLVRIDPELILRRQDNGQISVKDRECCDNFQNHPSA